MLTNHSRLKPSLRSGRLAQQHTLDIVIEARKLRAVLSEHQQRMEHFLLYRKPLDYQRAMEANKKLMEQVAVLHAYLHKSWWKSKLVPEPEDD
jgi:hypothetical protein